MNFYVYKFPDAYGQWVAVGWVHGAWDNSRKEWTDIYPALRALPPSESGWWYAFPDPNQPHGPDREGRYEAGSGPARLVLEYGLA